MKILLSIKPEFTERIFSGQKKYEFRKQRPKLPVEKVLIYECRPSKNIVGWFSIKRILSGTPKEIWEKCRGLSGIDKKEYFAYCNCRKLIYAFEIDRIFQFDIPINPFEVRPDFKPPQSFSYLENSPIFNYIKNREDDYKCLTLS
ncbi:ASCH domain-containing protein [candidate division WOR-3 bacterium]|nr:ASCH domain-containing protein [candidate division WOR-3 bacterium]